MRLQDPCYSVLGGATELRGDGGLWRIKSDLDS
jgi:hypothetical protein